MSPPRLPSSALRGLLAAQVEARLSPTRRALIRTQRLALLAALVPMVGLVAFLGAGLKGRPLPLTLLVVVGWTAVAVVGTRILMGSPSPLGASRPRLLLLAVLAPLAELSVSGVGMLLWPDTWSGALGVHAHLTCLMIGLAMGLAPLAALLWLHRGSDPVRPAALGAGLGGTAGTWGGAGSMLLCPHHSPLHVLIGHAVPVVLFALMGALVGAHVVALRRAE